MCIIDTQMASVSNGIFGRNFEDGYFLLTILKEWIFFGRYNYIKLLIELSQTTISYTYLSVFQSTMG